jgi:diguanylate cyclase (GGDEF)-like protein
VFIAIRRLNISAKLTLMCVLTTAIALFCVLLGFILQDLRLVKKLKEEQINTELTLLSNNLSALVAQDDTAAINVVVRHSLSRHSIVAIWVQDQDGGLIDSYPAHLQTMDDFNKFPKTHTSSEYSMQWVQRELTSGNLPLGEVFVWVTNADVETRGEQLRYYALLAFGFALLLSVVVGWLTQKIISAPLKTLQKLSQNIIESGDYSLRSALQTQDEIGQLSRAVDRMLCQIEQRDAMLEGQVAARTEELQQLADDFRYRALHDILTGLPNRAFLAEEFSRAVAHAKRVNKNFALLLLDLDNFKTINDSFGHDVGDELLKQVAVRMRSVLRGEDMICRLGGDEFVVLVEDVEEAEHVRSVGGNLLQTLHSEMWLGGRSMRLSVSIGAAIYPEHGLELSHLNRAADIAMYRAKETGKNQIVIYAAHMEQKALYRMLVQNDLRDGMLRDELTVYFQPQVDAGLHRLRGCEALVRWEHPVEGFLVPQIFLNYAEEHGLIRHLDYYVLRKACEACMRWKKELGAEIPISVNFSGTHFQSRALLASIKEILNTSGLPARLLMVEITEGVLIEDPITARQLLAEIRALGVRIGLDDFGAGYSTLNYLRTLEVDTVKLDRSFCQSVHSDANEYRMTKGIISLARDFGVELIAEGVENADQLHVLQELGCDYIQGYYFSKPLAEAEFIAWCRNFNVQPQLDFAL